MLSMSMFGWGGCEIIAYQDASDDYRHRYLDKVKSLQMIINRAAGTFICSSTLSHSDQYVPRGDTW